MPGIPTSKARGNQAEREALQFLQSHHCRLVVQNFSSKMGEIDLIMLDGDILVFVEVRYRKQTSRGTGAQTVTATKRSRIIKTAQYFLVTHPQYKNHACRFDVLSMTTAGTKKIDWILRAFTLDT